MTESDKQTGRHAKSVSLIYTHLPWDAGHSTSSPQRLMTYMVHGRGEIVHSSLSDCLSAPLPLSMLNSSAMGNLCPSNSHAKHRWFNSAGNHMAEFLGCSLTPATLKVFKDFCRLHSNLSAAAGQCTTKERLQLNRVTGRSD